MDDANSSGLRESGVPIVRGFVVNSHASTNIPTIMKHVPTSACSGSSSWNRSDPGLPIAKIKRAEES